MATAIPTRGNAHTKAAAISRLIGGPSQWVHAQPDGSWRVEGSHGEYYEVEPDADGVLTCGYGWE